MQIQQGDVLMEKVNEIHGNKLDHLILQEGELTGHAHRVSTGLAELFETGSTRYLNVISDEAVVTHEEHYSITLPKGIYKVSRVQEYDHFKEEARNVQD